MSAGLNDAAPLKLRKPLSISVETYTVLISSSEWDDARSESRTFVDQQPDEKLGPTIPFPTLLWQRDVRNEEFSFKSATKLRLQMVYEEKSPMASLLFN
jgi:hypothetical protein